MMSPYLGWFLIGFAIVFIVVLMIHGLEIY